MKLIKASLMALLVVFGGCSASENMSNPDEATSRTSIDSTYIASQEPANAMPVGQARESVETDQAVVLVGTIGGSSEPFVDGLAAFTIVDPKVPYCSSDEGCPTPWDYCCTQDQVKDNIATVKVVDSSGQPVATDARQLLGVQELSTVVVKGKAKRDDQGNLSLAATQVFVRSGE